MIFLSLTGFSVISSNLMRILFSRLWLPGSIGVGLFLERLVMLVLLEILLMLVSLMSDLLSDRMGTEHFSISVVSEDLLV